MPNLFRQNLAIWAGALGALLIVFAAWKHRGRVARIEAWRTQQLETTAKKLGLHGGTMNEESFFRLLLAPTALGQHQPPLRVSHCYWGLRHGAETWVCDIGDREEGEIVAGFHLPDGHPVESEAMRRGWQIEKSGEWLLVYRPGQRELGDLVAFLARAEALARPEIYQLPELPATPNDFVFPTPVASVSGESRRWAAFLRLKEWHGFFRRLEQMQAERPADDFVWAATCEKSDDAQPRTLGSLTPLSVAPAPNLAQPGGVGELLALLRRMPHGREVIDAFWPFYQKGDIKVKQVTEHLKQSLQRHPPALFVYRADVKSKIIYVDLSKPQGLLAPVLLHEIVHSLDTENMHARDLQEKTMERLATDGQPVLVATSERLHKGMIQLATSDFDSRDLEPLLLLKEQVDDIADIATYKSERKAADVEFLVSEELVRAYPYFYDHLVRDGKPARYQPHRATGTEVIEHYALNRQTIERYLKGQCRVLELQ